MFVSLVLRQDNLTVGSEVIFSSMECNKLCELVKEVLEENVFTERIW